MELRDLGDGARLDSLRPGDAVSLHALTDANRDRLREWFGWVDLPPGLHIVEVQAPGHLAARREFVVERADAGREILLILEPVAPKAADPDGDGPAEGGTADCG